MTTLNPSIQGRYSLIVSFKMDAAQKHVPMQLLGKTYSGLPVKGVVDSTLEYQQQSTAQPAHAGVPGR
jgi:hypothetical protein